jgi:hypothetical protein
MVESFAEQFLPDYSIFRTQFTIIELVGPVVAHSSMNLEVTYFSWSVLIDDGELITRAANVQIPNNYFWGDEREAAKLR